MHPAPRLSVELVPRSCWLSNVRTVLSQLKWDMLRRDVYREARYRCEVCGGRGERHPVECHEVWSYQDEDWVQRLIGMVVLCPACHEVKHLGRSERTGRGDAAFDHLLFVNDWTPEVADAYLREATERWRRRSRRRWRLDLSALAAYGIPPRNGGSYLYGIGPCGRPVGPEFQGVLRPSA